MAVAIDFSPLSRIPEQIMRRTLFEQQQADRAGIEALSAMDNATPGQFARAYATSNPAAAVALMGQEETRRTNEASERNGIKAMAQLGRIMGGDQPAQPAQPQGGATRTSNADDSHIPRGLLANESGGNWAAQNTAVGAGGQVGHFGRLQFGVQRLRDAQNAGVIPQGTTPQQFMANPDMQRRVEQWHFRDIDNFITRNGFERYVGTNIAGVPVTWDGMRSAAHLGGLGGLTRFLQSGGQYNPADANGTRLSDYLAAGARGGERPGSNPNEPLAILPNAPANAAQQPQPAQPQQVAAVGTPAATDASPPTAAAGPAGTPATAPVPLPPERPNEGMGGMPVAQPVAPAAAQPTQGQPSAQAQQPGYQFAAPQGQNVQQRLLAQLPALAMLAANRSMPEGARTIINTMVTQAMQEARGSELEREYRAAQANGNFRGTFMEYIRAKAGPPSLQQTTGSDGVTYRGYADPTAPASGPGSHPAFPGGGFRVVGSGDRQEPTYREVTLRNGDRATMVTHPDGRTEWLQEPGGSNSPFATSQAEQREARGEARRANLARSEARFTEIDNAGRAAGQQVAAFDEMRRLIRSGGLDTGAGAELNNNLRRVLITTGLATQEQANRVQNYEQFRAMATQSIMAGLNGSLGSGVSNADRDFIAQINANTSNTPAGNLAIIDFMQGLAERRIAMQRMAREYRRTNDNNLDDGFDNIADEFNQNNPISQVRQRGYWEIHNNVELQAVPRGATVRNMNAIGTDREYLRR